MQDRNPHLGKDPLFLFIYGLCSASQRQLLCVVFLNLLLEGVDLRLELLDGRLVHLLLVHMILFHLLKLHEGKRKIPVERNFSNFPWHCS